MKYLKIIILIVIIILLYLYLPRHSWVEQDVINELNNNYIYIPNRKSDDYFKDIIFKEQQVWKYELSEQEMKEINEYIDNGNFVRLTEDSFDYLKLWWYVKYENEIIFAIMKPKIAFMQVYFIFAYLQYVINAL